MIGENYDGPERRKENIALEPRVRDLEEQNRAQTKSRQAMHKQIGDLSAEFKTHREKIESKLDIIIMKHDSKAEDCFAHKLKTQSLETEQAGIIKTIAEVRDEQKWAFRTGVSGLATSLIAAITLIWRGHR